MAAAAVPDEMVGGMAVTGFDAAAEEEEVEQTTRPLGGIGCGKKESRFESSVQPAGAAGALRGWNSSQQNEFQGEESRVRMIIALLRNAAAQDLRAHTAVHD